MRYVLLFTSCHAVQYKVTFKRVSAFAKPGTAVRGDVDDAIVEVREFIRKGGHPGFDGEARLAKLLKMKAT